MIDLVSLLVSAGDGGDGRVSFFRAKYITKGGPDGGDGGRGGSVWLRASSRVSSLKHLAGVKQIKAKPGQLGGRRKQFGASSEDVEIELPVGTRVWLVAQNEVATRRWRSHDLAPLPRANIHLKRYFLTKEGEPIPFDQDHTILEPAVNKIEKVVELKTGAELSTLEVDDNSEILKQVQDDQVGLTVRNDVAPLSQQPARVLIELLEDNQRVLLCQGGIGGKGNVAFARSDRQTPLMAEYGYPGERRQIELELRLLADIGLVGLPSVGKSTLLSILTSSRPKIAAYPFTTLEPNLGVMDLPDKRSLVIADIPGIIAGASQGKGLGIQFLRHVSHCQAICYVLAVSVEELIDIADVKNFDQLVASLWQQYGTVREEIALSYPELIELPSLAVLNKVDLYPEELVDRVVDFFQAKSIDLLPISGATKQGVEPLRVLFDQIPT